MILWHPVRLQRNTMVELRIKNCKLKQRLRRKEFERKKFVDHQSWKHKGKGTETVVYYYFNSIPKISGEQKQNVASYIEEL